MTPVSPHQSYPNFSTSEHPAFQQKRKGPPVSDHIDSIFANLPPIIRDTDLDSDNEDEIPYSKKSRVITLIPPSEMDFIAIPDLFDSRQSKKERLTELKRGLQSWSEKAINAQKNRDNYVKASELIIDAFVNERNDLNLSSLGLRSIPPEVGYLIKLENLNLLGNSLESLPESFGEFKKLTILNLSENRLESLPEAIGELNNLTVLNLSINKIKSLPESFGKLTKLEELDLSNNQLESLPESFGGLTELRKLFLLDNLLKSLPESFGNLTELRNLFLFDNLLESLPESFGGLTKLEELDLSENRVESLPESFGGLTNLSFLDLTDNQLGSLPPIRFDHLQGLRELKIAFNQLYFLPLEIFNLHNSCTIDLSGCPFSQTALLQLRSRTSATGYQGPRFNYSIHEESPHSKKTLDELLSELYNISGEEQKTLTFLNLSQDNESKNDQDITFAHIENIRIWLSKIANIADARDEENKIKLACRIIENLELAEKDSSFRERFLQIIDDATTTCGDRVALSIIHLGIAKRLIQLNHSFPRQVANELRQVWIIDQLEKIAREKIETLACCDPIEVYLGYLIKLKDKLHIDLDVQNMLYFSMSDLKDADLTKAYEDVSKRVEDLEAQCEFLATQPDWGKVLGKLYPDEYEDAVMDYKKIIELTKKALASPNFQSVYE